ncbi:unnamed protein product [marine sediment metagenome]|uniref:Dihydrodipicolinate synthase n=1 Tax=marine sediment metagenome TaxID=412755 RepID=X1ELA7_9ZZZZ
MDKKFQGVYAVICTPFTEDDKIDETALRKHLRYLVDRGNVHGIIPTGSTGEFAAMSDQELAAVQKDIQKVRELYFKLLPLLTMFETTGQYVQLTKAGLEILGRPYGNPRRPLLPPTDEDKQRLREVLETLIT